MGRAGSFNRAYPRVGGGASLGKLTRYGLPGLSPRGRGSHALKLERIRRDGPIPAWAGEPAVVVSLAWPSRAYPRVGGGARTR